MFSANVVGTANATAAGWGKLGRWCDTDLYDLRAVQSHGGIWHGG